MFLLKCLITITIAASYVSAFAEGKQAIPLRVLYEKLMFEYPSSVEYAGSCAKPKIGDNKNARRYRTVFSNHTLKGPLHPNFCGAYYLFNEPITGGGIVFLLDCKTGKIFDFQEEYASNGPLINPQSCLLIEWPPNTEDTIDTYVPSAYGPPRLYVFKDKKLKVIKDPIYSSPAKK